MSDERQEQARPGNSGQHSAIRQAAPADNQDTWDGGGREPVHPDDIDNEGVYLGKNMPKQRLRSDDN